MSIISVSKIESVVLDAYAEFYATNKELFKSNIEEYWFFASKFKDDRVCDAIYHKTNRLDKDYDPTEDVYIESTKLLDSLEHKKHHSKHKFFIIF